MQKLYLIEMRILIRCGCGDGRRALRKLYQLQERAGQNERFSRSNSPSACAVYYQWIEKIDPDMFAEIQKRVKEGRWNIVGGWFLQPDCNIPDGEALHAMRLFHKRYFKEKFGVTAKTGYNVDSFGHNRVAAENSEKSGMDNYVFMRPMPEEDIQRKRCLIGKAMTAAAFVHIVFPGTHNFSEKELLNGLKRKQRTTKKIIWLLRSRKSRRRPHDCVD